MRSIRLSLVLCFLALLALALGTVSLLVYRTTKESLLDKERSAQAFLTGRYESRCQAVNEELDERILRRAQTLARMAQTQWGYSAKPPVHAIGLIGIAPAPISGVAVPAWLDLAELRAQRRRLPFITIGFAEDVLSQDSNGVDQGYFQTNDYFGKLLQKSDSMAEQAFPLDPSQHDELALFEWVFDDTKLGASHVRRVILKAPVSRFRFQPPPPGHRWGPNFRDRDRDGKGNGKSDTDERTADSRRPNVSSKGGPRRPNVPGDPRRASKDNKGKDATRGSGPRRPMGNGRGRPGIGNSPTIFILCASETSERDQALLAFKGELQDELAQLDEDSKATLGSLRIRLWSIAFGTFVAVALGGFWLVRLGLAPLQRLSEAVGAITEKDFRLRMKTDKNKLPSELAPIVDRLDETLLMLERAFARERQAAADISHELRTPLSALLASTELGLRKTRTPAEYREILENCHLSSQHMSRLVERLLALARLDAGVDTYRPSEVDVADLVRECARIVRPLAASRGIELRVDAPESETVTTDPDKLREIVGNLLNNAVEYNKPEGSVGIALSRSNGTLQIDVEDTGIGISAETRAKVFDRFFRADSSRQSEGLHAGLGLAIVKSYVDLMGGEISVDSAPDEGATFHLRLPAGSKSSRSEPVTADV